MSIAQSEAYEERKLPIIDVSGLHGAAIDRSAVARELTARLHEYGLLLHHGA